MTQPSDTPGRHSQLLIAGRWTDGDTSADVIDKFRLGPCGTAELPSRAQVASCVAAAREAFRANRLDAYSRGAILDRAAVLLDLRTAELAGLLTAEAGFTRHDAAGEIRRALITLRVSAEEARRFAGELVPMEGAPGQAGRIGFTLRVPLGVVCAITPFNAPLNTVIHKVGPALAAGNAVVLKPSLHTPGVACVLAEVLAEAGLPAGLLSVLHGGAEVAQWLLEEADVNFYAFTGSTEVGRAIQQRAGLRRTQMELGSIACCVLCDDANLDIALPKITDAGYRKAGQVCTSIQRLLVHELLADEVERRLTERVAALVAGDPADARTSVGPVISLASAERIEEWIREAVSRGARLLAGGTRQGAVVAPTLLADVGPETALGCHEVFGPVMCLSRFSSVAEAVEQVNATPYGLATGFFTNRIADAFHAARTLEVGGVHINETSSSRIDLMPYGGTKDSGFGREGPRYAIREMSEERIVTFLA